MTYSIEKMEEKIHWIREKRAALEKLNVNRNAIHTIDEALRIIAELAGRLSSAEKLLAAARADLRVARRPTYEG